MSQPKLPKESNSKKYKILSLNIRYYRNRLQMTQDQVSSKAGISSKYLSLIESSSFINPPTLEVVFDLAEVLGVEPYRLFREL